MIFSISKGADLNLFVLGGQPYRLSPPSVRLSWHNNNNASVSIKTLYSNADCHLYCVSLGSIMLSAIRISVIMQSVVMLSVVASKVLPNKRYQFCFFSMPKPCIR
jgi:hypothetical protein